MTLSDALEFFKKGYKECFNLSDIKKSEIIYYTPSG